MQPIVGQESVSRDYVATRLQPLLRRIVEVCLQQHPENPAEFLRQWFNDGCCSTSSAPAPVHGGGSSNQALFSDLPLPPPSSAALHFGNTETWPISVACTHDAKLPASIASSPRSSPTIVQMSQQLHQRLQIVRRASLESDCLPWPDIASEDDGSDNMFTAALHRGFILRDDEVLRSIYARHASPSQAMLAESLPAAIDDAFKAFGSIPHVSKTCSTHSGSVKFEDFRSLVAGSTAVAAHVARSAVAQVLADAIGALCGTADDSSLQKFVSLSPDALGAAITAAAPGVLLAVSDVQAGLRRMLAQTAAQCSAAGSSKFHTNKMACGSISDFHQGVTARVGPSRSHGFLPALLLIHALIRHSEP
jgi:hypothetical protein